MTERLDIIISANSDEAVSAIQKLNQEFNKLNNAAKISDKFSQYGVAFDSLGRAVDSSNNQFISAQGILNKMKTGYAHILPKDLADNIAQVDWKSFEKGTTKAINGSKGLSFQLYQLQRNVLMFGLGVMFAGMQIRRTFAGIMNDTTSTFMKITEGQTSAGQAVTTLSAAFTYLKFTIGEAIATVLEPLLPMLVDIIEKVSDWVSNNQGLTAGVIVGGVALGAFMLTIGQTITLMASMISLVRILIPILGGDAGLTAALGGLGSGGVLSTLTGITYALMEWVPIIALILVILALLKISWDTNFGGFKTTVQNTANDVLALLGGLWNSASNILSDLYNFTAQIMAGNYDIAFKWAYKLGLDVIALVAKVLVDVVQIILDILAGIWNIGISFITSLAAIMAYIIKRAITGIMGFAQDSMNAFIDLANKIPGVNIAKQKGMDTAITAVDQIGSDTETVLKYLGKLGQFDATNVVAKAFGVKDLSALGDLMDKRNAEISGVGLAAAPTQTDISAKLTQQTLSQDQLAVINSNMTTTMSSLKDTLTTNENQILALNTTFAQKIPTFSENLKKSAEGMDNLNVAFTTNVPALDTSMNTLKMSTDAGATSYDLSVTKNVTALDGNTTTVKTLNDTIAKTVTSARTVNINLQGSTMSASEIEKAIEDIFRKYGITAV